MFFYAFKPVLLIIITQKIIFIISFSFIVRYVARSGLYSFSVLRMILCIIAIILYYRYFSTVFKCFWQ